MIYYDRRRHLNANLRNNMQMLCQGVVLFDRRLLVKVKETITPFSGIIQPIRHSSNIFVFHGNLPL